MERQMKDVTYDEMVEYLENYPRPVGKTVCTIIEPPVVEYYDDTIGDYPDNIIACFPMYSSNPADRYYEPREKWKAKICTNHNDLTTSDIKTLDRKKRDEWYAKMLSIVEKVNEESDVKFYVTGFNTFNSTHKPTESNQHTVLVPNASYGINRR